MEKKIRIEDIINKLRTIEMLISQGKTTKLAAVELLLTWKFDLKKEKDESVKN